MFLKDNLNIYSPYESVLLFFLNKLSEFFTLKQSYWENHWMTNFTRKICKLITLYIYNEEESRKNTTCIIIITSYIYLIRVRTYPRRLQPTIVCVKNKIKFLKKLRCNDWGWGMQRFVIPQCHHTILHKHIHKKN